MQAYSDPNRENDKFALPDVEVFYRDRGDVWNDENGEPFDPPKDPVELFDAIGEGAEPCEAGWYWWSCFPGCLPEGDANGPFETEAEAIADAQDQK